MTLTGLAKSNFEDYYQHLKLTKQHNLPTLEDFYELPDAMQWGVIQDWSDSIGLPIEVTVYGNTELFEYYVDLIAHNDVFDTRQEARNAAIEKLNQLINEQ